MSDYTRECLAIEVDRSLPGARVVRVLERLAATVGLPQRIVLDNGPEFAGRTLDAWAYMREVSLCFIRPGKPIENAYVESFNGKRLDYNTVRPHSALGDRTPDQFAQLTRGARRLSPPRPEDLKNPDGLTQSV
jgi:putative transposase